MADAIKKLLVLTSGGDAPGMNAVIRATVRAALRYGIEVYGCQGGFQGLIDERIFAMDHESVANCIQRGGTILQTGRFPEFAEKTTREKACKILQTHHFDALVVLGGDGSFRGGALLEEECGIKVIGIPCTIDNDIRGTEYAIGFDTARNTALHSIDRIRDTASSLNTNFLVEVMGRASGFLAVDVGIAGGAEFILIPESPITVEDLADRIQQRKRVKKASIIVVAEADDAGRSFNIAKKLYDLSGIYYRVCVLGHTQRGGSPTVKDRKIASMMGVKAINVLMKGTSKKMIAMVNNELILTEFPDPALGARSFSDTELLHLNEIICDV